MTVALAADRSTRRGRPRAETASTIVICGLPFDESPPFGDTHLGRALAHAVPTLVVDRPRPVHRVDAAPRGGRRRMGAWPVLEPLPGRPGSWVLRPVVLPGSERPGTARLSDPLFDAQVEWAAQRVLPPDPALVTFAPARGLLTGVSRSALVYWCRDLAASPHYTRAVEHVRARHAALLRMADLVTAVSPTLRDDAALANPHAELVPNGADVGHFESGFIRRTHRRGTDGRALPADAPVIGYAGAVSWRLDLDLVDTLCAEHPEWRIVLIGACDVALPQRANLIATGALPYSDLPDRVAGFDVGVVPYQEDDFNRASFPLKVFDYLATGVPVVATRLPSLVGLEPFVHLAGASAFGSTVQRALAAPPSPQACLTFARTHSWEQRAAHLLTLVQGVGHTDQAPNDVTQ